MHRKSFMVCGEKMDRSGKTMPVGNHEGKRLVPCRVLTKPLLNR